MSTYTVYNAKTHLSTLIDQACAGEEVIIARGKRPLVKLVPLPEAGQRRFGAMRGRARVDDAFFEPLPE
jgi:antitoxin (DNA-binding transcriptional repressor) of toxin-antitoxin stability system